MQLFVMPLPLMTMPPQSCTSYGPAVSLTASVKPVNVIGAVAVPSATIREPRLIEQVVGRVGEGERVAGIDDQRRARAARGRRARQLTSWPTNKLFWKMWTPEMNGIVRSTVSGFDSETNAAS